MKLHVALLAVPVLGCSGCHQARSTLPPDLLRLAGSYSYDGDGASFTLELAPDGGCRLTSKDEEGASDLTGRWGYGADGHLGCRNDPGPARLDLVAPPTRDPRVAMVVDARLPSGAPASGLALATEGQLLIFDSDGREVIRTEEEMPDSRQLSIQRAADGQVLWSGRAPRGGPNTFLFTYDPTATEPRAVSFAPGSKPGRVEVELGQGAIELTRVGDAR